MIAHAVHETQGARDLNHEPRAIFFTQQDAESWCAENFPGTGVVSPCALMVVQRNGEKLPGYVVAK